MLPTAFTHALIIYNPNSTGDSETIARDFYTGLRKLKPSCKVALKQTTHAGHGEELGYELTKSGRGYLLVSVSGDGGYHELVNGVMRAVDEGARPSICAVLPGGNANDHYSYISKRTLLEAIAADGLTNLDLLRVETTTDGAQTRYAHSYAGLGLTPLVAAELNTHDLTIIRENWLVLKTFWNLKPFKIIESDKVCSYDSLILANIGVMAKYLSLDSGSSPRDGKFEVLRWPHQSRLGLTGLLAKTAAGKDAPPPSVKYFSFKTIKRIPMQLDGELIHLAAAQVVRVSIAPGKLKTYG